MQRGEIWWAQLEPPAGRRPVLLLSRNKAYEFRLSVTVAHVTRTRRGIKTEVSLDEKDGMPVKCVVNLDDIATIPKVVLIDKLTTLSAEKMQDVTDAIIFALNLKN
jgi:mRNA interferase MazF